MVYVMWDCYLQGAEENHKQSISVFKDEPIMPLYQRTRKSTWTICCMKCKGFLKHY